MKKTLFLALMLVIGATAFAQQQMATLNHNDTITVFYGPYALKDAHNAAVAGDIVTLSPGTFEKCDITKPITLRGAGATIDTIAGTYPTVITGNFTQEEAKDLADLISSGALPFDLVSESQEYIGPTIGHQALEVTVKAGLIALIVIMLLLPNRLGVLRHLFQYI